MLSQRRADYVSQTEASPLEKHGVKACLKKVQVDHHQEDFPSSMVKIMKGLRY